MILEIVCNFNALDMDIDGQVVADCYHVVLHVSSTERNTWMIITPKTSAAPGLTAYLYHEDNVHFDSLGKRITFLCLHFDTLIYVNILMYVHVCS